jgi:hypothetical protein
MPSRIQAGRRSRDSTRALSDCSPPSSLRKKPTFPLVVRISWRSPSQASPGGGPCSTDRDLATGTRFVVPNYRRTAPFSGYGSDRLLFPFFPIASHRSAGKRAGLSRRSSERSAAYVGRQARGYPPERRAASRALLRGPEFAEALVA